MYLKKVIDFTNQYKLKKKIKRLIEKNFFFVKSNDENTDNIILVEFNNWQIFHISSLYLLNSLKKIYKCKTFAFYNNCYLDRYINIDYFKKIKIFFLKTFGLKTFQFYKYLGCEDLIVPSLSSENSLKSTKTYLQLLKKIKKKNDILKLKIGNIKIGDLLYDSYLKRYKLDTINIESPNFKLYLKLFIDLFVYWDEYFDKNHVKSLISSHGVYTCGIPVRIAIAKKIKVFIPNVNFLYQLNKKQNSTDLEFFNYKSTFNKFSAKNKKKYIKMGKKLLESRFSGKFDKTIPYSKNQSYKKNTKKVEFIKKRGFNILIAAHSFSDAPHVYGNNLFPDFKEWLDFLGNLSKETDFNWYIKDNLDYPSTNKIFVNEFINRFPNIKQLPSNISHHYLKKKINLLLTCYGTMAHEYAYFGVPVINASKNNPHINYNFCLHPKTISDYKKNILKAKKLKIKISKKAIFEFIYMRYIYKEIGYTVNLNKFFNKNSFLDLFNSKIYSFFLKDFSQKKSNSIIKTIDHFVRSKKYIF